MVVVTAGGRSKLNLFLSFTVVGQYWKALCNTPKLLLVSVYLCFNNGAPRLAPLLILCSLVFVLPAFIRGGWMAGGVRCYSCVRCIVEYFYFIF